MTFSSALPLSIEPRSKPGNSSRYGKPDNLKGLRLAFLLVSLSALFFSAGASAGTKINFKDARGLETISGQMFTPEGTGPFPAIVMLHGCDGIHDYHIKWAKNFTDWGYIAFLVDSLGPRNIEETCDNPFSVSPELRQLDALGALQTLRKRKDVIADRVAIAGWSHGGWTALKAVSKNGMWRYTDNLPGGTFKTAVTIYPYCVTPAFFVSPVQILIGDKDDLTLHTLCEDLLTRTHENSEAITLKVYPGALHLFDSGEPISKRKTENSEKVGKPGGHLMGGDPAATADAYEQVKAYLAKNL